MVRYKFDHYHRHPRIHKYIKRLKFLSIIVGIIGLLAVIVVVEGRLVQRKSITQNDTTQVTKSSFYPSNLIFRTAYFQIQSPKSWIAIPAESRPDKFVYRSMNKNLVQQELDIYVNAPPLDRKVTHTMPIQMKGNSLIAKGISEHCSTKLPKGTSNRALQSVVLGGIQIICVYDNPEYSVLGGTEDGTTMIKMQRPDGSTGVYQFLYNNVTANPEARDLESILNSFQPR